MGLALYFTPDEVTGAIKRISDLKGRVEVRDVVQNLFDCKVIDNHIFCKIEDEWLGFTPHMAKIQLSPKERWQDTPDAVLREVIQVARELSRTRKAIGAFPKELELERPE